MNPLADARKRLDLWPQLPSAWRAFRCPYDYSSNKLGDLRLKRSRRRVGPVLTTSPVRVETLGRRIACTPLRQLNTRDASHPAWLEY